VKILFCSPPTHYYTGKVFNALPIVSIAILTRLFRDNGYDAEAVDYEPLMFTPEKVGKIIAGANPDVVGFTVLSTGAKGVEDCIRNIRKEGYKGFIVLGGIHATLFPETCLAWGADLIVKGECEGNLVELIESRVTGIVEGVKPDINNVPSPDWDHYLPDIKGYRGQYNILHPSAGVAMWTRGCPYSCVYCGNKIFNGQPTRFRPPYQIAKEMLDLWNRGIEKVYVYDDECIGAKQPAGWLEEIADLIEGLGMTWIIQGRCSKKYITKKLLLDMKRAGCKLILWGVESFSQDVLDAVKKRLTPEDIWHSLRLAKEVGIKNNVFIIVGNYKETEKDLQITEDALRKAYNEGLIDYRQSFTAQIMPGTEMETIAKRDGWYEPPTFGGMKNNYNRKVDMPWLKVAKINEWKQRLEAACPTRTP